MINVYNKIDAQKINAVPDKSLATTHFFYIFTDAISSDFFYIANLYINQNTAATRIHFKGRRFKGVGESGSKSKLQW